MTATERARRSDSLYYDTATTHRRALCDRIANLESDLKESKARNAKTFEVGKRFMARAARLESENTELKAENVRLLHIIGECTSQLRKKYGLDYVVMPMGAAQALCETVAEIVSKRYDMTDEGVEFDD